MKTPLHGRFVDFFMAVSRLAISSQKS